MAQITLNATAAQSARIQEAVAIYNATHETTLTVKQWVYSVLRQAVIDQLSEQQNAAAQAVRAAIQTEMSGGT